MIISTTIVCHECYKLEPKYVYLGNYYYCFSCISKSYFELREALEISDLSLVDTTPEIMEDESDDSYSEDVDWNDIHKTVFLNI